MQEEEYESGETLKFAHRREESWRMRIEPMRYNQVQHEAASPSEPRKVLKTFTHCNSSHLHTHRELLKIRKISREYWYKSSVSYRVSTNVPHIREVLWNGEHRSLFICLDSKDQTNIREFSLQYQHVSLGIFLKLINLLNIREFLQWVFLPHLCLFLLKLPIILINYVGRHTRRATIKIEKLTQHLQAQIVSAASYSSNFAVILQVHALYLYSMCTNSTIK